MLYGELQPDRVYVMIGAGKNPIFRTPSTHPHNTTHQMLESLHGNHNGHGRYIGKSGLIYNLRGARNYREAIDEERDALLEEINRRKDAIKLKEVDYDVY